MSVLSFTEIGGFFKYGYMGVDIFFIISGFVISLSISDRSLVHFWISRLYPLYWISVLATFVVIITFGAPRFTTDIIQLLCNLTMFQNYIGSESIDGVYWTLFIEMKFYLFVISTYLIINKWKEIKLDYLIYTWLSLTVLYLFLNELSILRVANKYLIFDWSANFIAGIIFYQIYKSKLNLKYALLLLVSFLIVTHYAIEKIEKLELYYKTTFSSFIVIGITVLFYTLMLLVACKKLNSINSSKLIKIGMLTYPLYLLHQNIGFIIFNNSYKYTNKYVIVISTTILMLFLAFIMSEYLEKRISNYFKTKLKQLTKTNKQ